MKRHTLPWATFVVALCLALPAGAGNGRSVNGLIAAVSQHSVAVKSRRSIITTCVVARVSPSLRGYAAGDPVQMLCRARKGRLVLARIHHLNPTTVRVQKEDAAPVTFGGAITALSDDSISLHDGNRDLNCELDSASPSTADFKVGQHVKAVCAGGKLVRIAPVTPADAGRYYTGTVSTLDGRALTLQTEHGLITCTLGAGSPSTAELHVGDRIGMGCNAATMQVVLIRKLDSGDAAPQAPPAPPAGDPTTHATTGARGDISAVSSTGVSVHTDGGTVTCQLGASSPALGDLAVGDHVAIKCVDGVLSTLERVT